jgi:hypothetical protein
VPHDTCGAPRDVGGLGIEPTVFVTNDASDEVNEFSNETGALLSFSEDLRLNGNLPVVSTNFGNNTSTARSGSSTASWQYTAVYDQEGAFFRPEEAIGNSTRNVEWYTSNNIYSPILDSNSATCIFPQHSLASIIPQTNTGIQDQYTMPPQIMMQPQILHKMISGGASFYPPMAIATQRTLCSFCTETFARPSDLDRHWQSVHLGIKYHCFRPGCPNNRGKGYCRLEKLRTHQREKHGFAWS